MKKYYIYKLVCNNIEVKYAYVGHTKNWSQRKSKHKYDSKDEKTAHRKVYKIITENGGWENWCMILQQICFCESKADAVEIERRYYDALNEHAINTYRPMRTSEELKEYQAEWNKQYRIDNESTVKQYLKNYRNDNKDALKEQRKQYRNDNKETIASSKKLFYIDNKEKIASRLSEKIYCDACKCCTSRRHISRHNKSQRHQNNINKITE